VQAQISVDHGELGTAISAHIPSVQAKLGNELGLHASIEVTQSGSSLSGEQYQSQQRDNKAYVQSGNLADDTKAETVDLLAAAALPDVMNAGRLDIRA
jgi:hypothetical protein